MFHSTKTTYGYMPLFLGKIREFEIRGRAHPDVSIQSSPHDSKQIIRGVEACVGDSTRLPILPLTFKDLG